MKLKILDATGHKELELAPCEAAAKVQEAVQNGEWIFVDGRYVELGQISAEALEDASEAVITPALQAG